MTQPVYRATPLPYNQALRDQTKLSHIFLVPFNATIENILQEDVKEMSKQADLDPKLCTNVHVFANFTKTILHYLFKPTPWECKYGFYTDVLGKVFLNFG